MKQYHDLLKPWYWKMEPKKGEGRNAATKSVFGYQMPALI